MLPRARARLWVHSEISDCADLLGRGAARSIREKALAAYVVRPSTVLEIVMSNLTGFLFSVSYEVSTIWDTHTMVTQNIHDAG